MMAEILLHLGHHRPMTCVAHSEPSMHQKQIKKLKCLIHGLGQTPAWHQVVSMKLQGCQRSAEYTYQMV